MMIRHAGEQDLQAVLKALQALQGPWPFAEGDVAEAVWRSICAQPGTVVFLGEAEGEPIATATLHVLPNLTFRGSPYALVENVSVRGDHQGAGFGRMIMQAVIDAAWKAGCYKIMLMTGVGNQATGFYQKLGFADDQKHALVMRRAPVRN